MTRPSGADVAVVVIGGGPVGLTTALELAFHDVPTLIVEPRVEVDHSRPRAKTTSARSMELFRRTGAADEIRRRAPLPVEWSDEVRFCTTVAGAEITRMSGVLGLDLAGSDLTSEAAQQVTQPIVEEALRALLARQPLVETRWGSRGVALDLSDALPHVTIADAAGAESTVTADYVVGADGTRSIVREAIGAQYVGAAGGRPNVNITFRSAALAGLLPGRPAVHNWVLNPASPGIVGPLDLDGTWWAISTGTTAIADDAEAAAIVRALVGADIDVEVLATDPWQARLLLADRYGDGRAFLAGDAAHQNPPWGGHGFNTGVGDAVNLAWKLAAVHHGWAPPELLDSYEAERRPVAQRTIDLAATNMRTLATELASPLLTDEGAAADRARAAAAHAVQTSKRAEFHSLGLVLGYGYGPDAAASSALDDLYVPVARPGSRLPHARNAAGESLYDLLGPAFTVLGPGTRSWAAAAADLGIPLAHADPVAHGFPPVANGDTVLVRPDQHIAWRGPSAIEPTSALLGAVRGFGPDV